MAPELGTAAPDPPTGEGVSYETRLIPVLEQLAALSGGLLLGMYAAGRFYFESYARGFELRFSDLDLSIQDVTFGTLSSVLIPIFVVVGSLVYSWFGRSPSIVEKFRAAAALDNPTAEIAGIKLNWYSLLLLIEGLCFGVTVSMFLLTMWVGFSWSWHEHAILSSLQVPMEAFLGSILVYLLLQINLATSRRAALWDLAIIGLMAVVIIPSVMGRITGLKESSARHGETESVVIVTRQQIDQRWEAASSGYMSPPLKLVATGSTIVTLWDFANQSAIQIPLSEVLVISHVRD